MNQPLFSAIYSKVINPMSNFHKPLYVQRLVNLFDAQALYNFSRHIGLKNPVAPEKMHITVASSKQPVYWLNLREDKNSIIVSPDKLKIMGADEKALVLTVKDSGTMQARFDYYLAGGCSFDFPNYIPHITLAYDVPDLPPTTFSNYFPKHITLLREMMEDIQ